MCRVARLGDRDPSHHTFLIQNVRLFFYVSRCVKTIWVRSLGRKRQNSMRVTSKAEHRIALAHWPNTRNPSRPCDAANQARAHRSPPAPRAPQNADLSRIPTRFDTTEYILVTSRALCWLVAFAAFSANSLKIDSDSLQNVATGYGVHCALANTAAKSADLFRYLRLSVV